MIKAGTDTILYIIISLILVALSASGRKKKKQQADVSNSPLQVNSSSKTIEPAEDPMSTLTRFFESIGEPEILPRYTTIAEPEVIPITAIHEDTKPVNTIPSPEENKELTEARTEYESLDFSKYNIEEKAESKEYISAFAPLIQNFDARKAFIYSEIFNKKY
jgi:hypothetical protein